MRRPLYTPSTMPPTPAPDPLLLFIQQALLSLATREPGVRPAAGTGPLAGNRAPFRTPVPGRLS